MQLALIIQFKTIDVVNNFCWNQSLAKFLMYNELSRWSSCEGLLPLNRRLLYLVLDVKVGFLFPLREHTRCWDLSSFLIKPVQRVLKYPLLLNELLKVSPDLLIANYTILPVEEKCFQLELWFGLLAGGHF